MIHKIPLTSDEYLELTEAQGGVCLECGCVKFGDCEPDAEEYECDDCGAMAVAGVEQALIMGRVDIIE